MTRPFSKYAPRGSVKNTSGCFTREAQGGTVPRNHNNEGVI